VCFAELVMHLLQVVAIKQLNRDSNQGNKEFQAEVVILSLLHHENLVTLVGYCVDGDQRLLVYEYMPLGSLEDHLHGKAVLSFSVLVFRVLMPIRVPRLLMFLCSASTVLFSDDGTCFSHACLRAHIANVPCCLPLSVCQCIPFSPCAWMIIPMAVRPFSPMWANKFF
jgi:hypothetical protein